SRDGDFPDESPAKSAPRESTKDQPAAEEVLVISVICRDAAGFKGPALLQNILESGLRFVGQLDGLKQEPMLAGVVCGSRLPEGWAQGRDGVDFFDVKADVEAVLGFA
ncbi:hypothetical protein NK293_23085, partial [Salmonella enterica]|nr:hypothetical protein [Salmonella enterica]